MATKPYPVPTPGWSKFIQRLLPWASVLLEHLVDYYNETSVPQEMAWRQFRFRFEDQYSVDNADDAWISFDILNITDGNVDNTWTDTDRTNVVNKLANIFNVYATYMSGRLTLTECKVYVRHFNPYGTTDPDSGRLLPFAPSGPPEAIFPLAVSGISSVVQAPQVALSVTELTPRRQSWGRFYLPALSPANLGANGQVSVGVIDALGAAVKTAYEEITALQLYPVVPITMLDKQQHLGLLGVTGIQVDSIADVIRRRRPKHASNVYRS